MPRITQFTAALFIALQFIFVPAFAAPDDDFLAARDTFNARNGARLDQYARKLQEHPLAPFVHYWQLSLNLDAAKPEEVKAFLDGHGDVHVSDRLRAEWLKVLGKQKQWEQFQAELPRLVNEDAEVACYQLQARLAVLPTDKAPLAEAKRLWFSGADLASSCNPLFEQLADEELLSVDDVFARLRLALEAGNVSVARYVAQYLPGKYQSGVKPLESAADNPSRFLEKHSYDLSARGGREMVLFAIHRIARTDPEQAIHRWESIKSQFSPEEQAYVAGQIALHLARRHEPNALAWFGYAKEAPLSDLQLAWKARAAMRAQDWNALLSAIAWMSEAEKRRPEWRYWFARALKSLGLPVAADEQFAVLSREHHFYGQLASEELGAIIGPAVATYKPAEEEIKTMANNPALQRALALYRLNLRLEGLREWTWAIRKFDDKQLLAAAELARRNDLYDRAINTADRTQQLHDFSLRYPAPYLDTMQGYTKPLNLDDAWVYGLVRQESRFIQVAKSSVGASGMMQLMPATAKWVAKKLGMKSFSLGVVNKLDTNFALGTYYMKHVLDTLSGSPVLATAAYNAGPGRARKWQEMKPMEAAAYVESIPFNETRDYVKKVMSNSAYYAARFGNPLTSLKKRLGIIPGRSKEELPSDEP
ncbi:MAG: lytic transglycosylase domain-containing protein [Hydrogenophilales bacterium]|nr:lytic transglycosylase domain-containing protein [Hydrogenophilales bacterium]